jgi:hypothetical protein
MSPIFMLAAQALGVATIAQAALVLVFNIDS